MPRPSRSENSQNEANMAAAEEKRGGQGAGALPSEEKRLQIRQGYRALIDKVTQHEDDVIDLLAQDEGIVGEAMAQADQLFTKVDTPQEAVLDAQIAKQLARLCRQQAEGLSTNIQTFHPNEFAEKLIQNMGGRLDEETGMANIRPERWCQMGLATKSLFARAPALHYLYGSIKKSEIVKKERQRRLKQKDDPRDLVKTVSTQLTADTEKSDTPQTEALVASTYAQLVQHYKANGKRPFSYLRFVIHPDSFGATVENIFHVSFLVKESKCAIFVDEETELPMIEPIRKKSKHPDQDDGQGARRKKQVVISLCVSEWQELKEALLITRPMIVHAPSGGGGGGGSQGRQQQQHADGGQGAGGGSKKHRIRVG